MKDSQVAGSGTEAASLAENVALEVWNGEAKTDVTIGKYDYGGLFLRMPWRKGINGEVVNAARQRNEQLAAEVDDLREGLEMVEERARAELGMVKPDEVFVQVTPQQR